MSEVKENQPQTTWEALLVDGRIAKRLRDMGLEYPLEQQKEAIGAVLRQRDLLLASKTGSGKTLSFLIPAVQLALSKQSAGKKGAGKTCVLILEPTKELCKQTEELLCALCQGLGIEVRALVAEEVVDMSKVAAKQDGKKCDIMLGTPNSIKDRALSDVELLVIDEVDLMCAFSFQTQLQELCQEIPAQCQKVLCSATLPQETVSFSGLLLKKDAVSITEAERKATDTAFHYFAFSSDLEKYLLLFALYKLEIIQGRSIIFTPKINEAHRVKFFLERFGIKPLLFAPSLPLEYRQTQIQRFNLGAADILIVSGEETTEEAGVIRGIDFEAVDVVLNFSLPQTVEDLLHIAGRAGRGTNQPGVCLSFIIDIEEETCRSGNLKREFSLQNQLLAVLMEKHPEVEFQYQEMNMTALQSEFGYRVRDVFTQMTDKNIQKYRLQQLQNLAFESAELRQHFRQHQKDALLMQRKTSAKAKGLTAIPEYLKAAADGIRSGCSFSPDSHSAAGHSYARRSALLRKLAKK